MFGSETETAAQLMAFLTETVSGVHLFGGLVKIRAHDKDKRTHRKIIDAPTKVGKMTLPDADHFRDVLLSRECKQRVLHGCYI